MFFFTSLLLLLTVPVTVSACEGDCIVGITNAFLTNYARPIDFVMENIAKEISSMLPQHPNLQTSLGYLQPLMDAYEHEAYDGMEKAIFPSHFHGKCLKDGIEPDGCPNPDCPVVCGTPGSLVHFYPKLRYIAYNQTSHSLKALSTPGSKTYNEVEQLVLSASPKDRRAPRFYQRTASYGTASITTAKRADDLKTELKETLAKIGPMLLELCGGADGETNGLRYCSWEQEMKNYILTFP